MRIKLKCYVIVIKDEEYYNIIKYIIKDYSIFPKINDKCFILLFSFYSL